MKSKKNKRASTYIEVSISILVISFILVFIISYFTIISQKVTLDRITDNICYSVSNKGCIDDEIISLIERYKEENNMDFTYSFICNYIQGENKIQLGDEITIKTQTSVKLLGIYDLVLASQSTKYSKVYFK